MSFSNIKYHLLLLLGLGLVWGCETVIDYHDEDFVPELVIHSVFAPDSIWEIHVSKTKPRFSDNFETEINNANVVVEDVTKHNTIEFQYKGNNVYTSPSKPIGGHVYHLLVEHEDLGRSAAIGKVPKVNHIYVTADIHEHNSEQSIEISIASNSHDNEATDSYYAWQLVEFEEDDDDGGIILDPSEGQFTSPALVTTRNLNPGGLIFIPGNEFQDNAVSETIESDELNEVLNDPINLEGKAAIKLTAISKNLYDYYDSTLNNPTFSSSNNTKPQVYSNIIDGYGFFGGYHETIIRL